MMPKMIAHIEATGQEILGNLRFDTVVMDGGWKINDKGKRYWERAKYVYFPVFDSYQLLKKFRGISRITVNNKFEFMGYCVNDTRLNAMEPVNELPGEQKEQEWDENVC